MLPRDLGRRAATFTHGDGMAREIKGVTASYRPDQCHVRFMPAGPRDQAGENEPACAIGHHLFR